MARLIFAFIAPALSSLTAKAQVKIHIPQQHREKYETIHASVQNTGSQPITFCIEVGRTCPKRGGEIEAAPSPFWVRRNNNGRWSTLLIGPDVGSSQNPEVLDPGKSLEFPFRLGASGQMRLRLNSWNGSLPTMDCRASSKDAKVVTPAAFTVQIPTQPVDIALGRSPRNSQSRTEEVPVGKPELLICREDARGSEMTERFAKEQAAHYVVCHGT